MSGNALVGKTPLSSRALLFICDSSVKFRRRNVDATKSILTFSEDRTHKEYPSFVITSHSPQRAIISGPGGSRVVSNGSTITLGGVVWKVQITEAGVNFVSGGDKVTLLFDRSLSTFNNSVSQSGQSSSTGSADSSQ